jgi:hypothetical protein
MDQISYPMCIESLSLGTPPSYLFSYGEAIYTLLVRKGECAQAKKYNCLAKHHLTTDTLHVPMYKNAAPVNMLDFMFDMIMAVTTENPWSCLTHIDANKCFMDKWGGDWDTIVGKDMDLPSDYSWGEVYRADCVPEGCIIGIQRGLGLGAVVLNEGPRYQAISGISFTQNNPPHVVHTDVPENGMGAFIRRSGMVNFKISSVANQHPRYNLPLSK